MYSLLKLKYFNSGCGKREAQKTWSMGKKPEEAASVTRICLEEYWSCASGLSAVNTIGAQLRDPINYLGIDPMAVDGICVDAVAESCASGLSAGNAIGAHLRNRINSGLTQWRLAVYVWTTSRKTGGIP